MVYLALLVTGGFLAASGPGAAGWVALLLTYSAALATTAIAAAPTHGRLSERDDALVARLLVADRCRCALAVLGALAATGAAVFGGA